MNKFRQNFGWKNHVFLPVIHVLSENQIIKNMNIALENGADGVFLIRHGGALGSTPPLSVCEEIAQKNFPNAWIGVNYLEFGSVEALGFLKETTRGLWSDNAGVGVTSDKEAQTFAYARVLAEWDGLYFGGVAFKHQEHIPPDQVGTVARNAIGMVDVITTSGDKTGQPPEIQKIQTMRESIGDYPLAIASGVNPQNVKQFMPYADCFLVATGISDSFYDFNPKKVEAFASVLAKSVTEV